MTGISFDVCAHCGVGSGENRWHLDTCQMVTEPHAIVRELARRGPFYTVDSAGDQQCADCLVYDYDTPPDPANHEPTCLWRRAKALYPGDQPAPS